ncbi:hypothetical protein CFP56_030940 [Quercus suber]|uniref:Uncharacterized protein n=1 Tax=Quercus suber TaxID=58331 RepID=A0AAW0JN05_QUESU
MLVPVTVPQLAEVCTQFPVKTEINYLSSASRIYYLICL